MILALSLGLILFICGIIHFNWVFGGTFGFAKSLPTNEQGERVLNPKKVDSAVVGIGLTSFGVLYILKSGLIKFSFPEWILNYVFWLIPIIFILRAIGDFKYIGFFKKVRTTDFARLDTKLFSPLCLLIGLLGVLSQLMK